MRRSRCWVPSRITHLVEGIGPSPGLTLAETAQRLQRAGATALALPCNTAHYYAPAITQATSVPFLSMVNLSVALAAQSLAPGDPIGFLASPALRGAGVFDATLARAGLTALWPKDTPPLLETIRLIKAQGPTRHALSVLTNVAEELTQSGASMLFAACSEFSLLAPDLKSRLPIIDTLDVLAHAIHQHALAQEVLH
ncbi:aspartate/glutamate racemase family protein [Aliiroseovarius subalbicans]|uniref:aspartate/glutamate racemase family protein n=1 Tax=Aliiroseovarius subalbicans TaxID=2925840 RepID=UPI001F57C21B|nr:aspartate/glutamate racemase family protein [Aliiroseovarius subalbicans]MCI2398175.1 aspartate/glutamate racemase family protein [Aliiroseovarius subalbicans]